MRPLLLAPLALVAALLAGADASAGPSETRGGAYLPGGWAASFSLSTASAAPGRISEARAGLGLFVLRDLSLGLEGAGGVASYPDDGPRGHTWQAGLDLAPRWHFHRGVLGSLFADAGLGLRYFGDRFPLEGSHLNFSARAGLGMSVNVLRSVSAAVGLRFLHLDSVDGKEADRAPAFDALELHLGALLAW